MVVSSNKSTSTHVWLNKMAYELKHKDSGFLYVCQCY